MARRLHFSALVRGGLSWFRLGLGVLPVVALGALARCAATGGDDESGGWSPGDASPCIGVGCGAGGSGATGGSGGGGGSGGAPPEQELESSFESPVATGRYVWAANPESGRVALVDADALEVRTEEAGFGPTYLAAVPSSAPGTDQAIVINVKSDDATFFRVNAAGEITAQIVEIHDGANSWTVSAGGKWAIAWTDASKISNADPTEGFQDVTVIDLAGQKPVSTRLSVGYRPTRLFMSADETRAFAVTEPGITVMELSGAPAVVKDVAVTDDPLESPASRDVTVTPDGDYALVRRDGSSEVSIVSLADGQRVDVTLSGPVTDLDLSADGTRAIAVVREPGAAPPPPPPPPPPADAGADGAADDGGLDGAAEASLPDAAPPAPPPSSEVFLLPIPGIFSAPGTFDQVTIDDEVVGSVSVSEQGSVALLYTNATPNDHLTILATASGPDYLSFRTVALKAPVKAVFPAPDSAHAIAVLAPGSGSGKPGAFSVVPITNDLPPKIQGTDAPPMSVAIAPPPSKRALVTVRDDSKKVFAVHLARMPELQVDKLPLASPPLAAGMVPSAGRGWVAQKHPEGRITFVDLDDGSARTLTGFELGAKVVDGSN